MVYKHAFIHKLATELLFRMYRYIRKAKCEYENKMVRTHISMDTTLADDTARRPDMTTNDPLTSIIHISKYQISCTQVRTCLSLQCHAKMQYRTHTH